LGGGHIVQGKTGISPVKHAADDVRLTDARKAATSTTGVKLPASSSSTNMTPASGALNAAPTPRRAGGNQRLALALADLHAKPFDTISRSHRHLDGRTFPPSARPPQFRSAPQKFTAADVATRAVARPARSP